jgi:hypothetical protein
MAEYDPDNIKFIRAAVKISSALYDIDEIVEHKRFKFNLKVDLLEWWEWSDEFIKGPMSVFGNTDSKTLTTLIDLFDDYSNKIYIKDVFTTRINLFLSKIESALHDLNGLLPENKERMEILISKITVLIKMGYFKPYKNYVDPYGKGYNDIVESMNILGNTIIIGTNENND